VTGGALRPVVRSDENAAPLMCESTDGARAAVVSTHARAWATMRRMPHRDFRPQDREESRRLVAILAWEIHDSDDGDRDELLGELLRLAWPTREALDH